MKRAVLAGAVGLMTVAGLVLPRIAQADEPPPAPPWPPNCTGSLTYAGTDGPVPSLPPVPTTVPPVSTTIPPVPDFEPDSAYAAVCINLGPNLTGFTGGAIGAGVTLDNQQTRLCAAGTPVPTDVPLGVYAIADGNNANTLSNSSGYFGVSNYETSATAAQCPALQDTSGNAGNGGTNSGGYVGVKGVLFLPVPFVACGFTSGPDYGSAGRDGCAIP